MVWQNATSAAEQGTILYVSSSIISFDGLAERYRIYLSPRRSWVANITANFVWNHRKNVASHLFIISFTSFSFQVMNVMYITAQLQCLLFNSFMKSTSTIAVKYNNLIRCKILTSQPERDDMLYQTVFDRTQSGLKTKYLKVKTILSFQFSPSSRWQQYPGEGTVAEI
jgi:hypothetical protein